MAYNNAEVKNKFAKANIKGGDRNLDFRGRSGDQVLKPGSGDRSQYRRSGIDPVASPATRIVPISAVAIGLAASLMPDKFSKD